MRKDSWRAGASGRGQRLEHGNQGQSSEWVQRGALGSPSNQPSASSYILATQGDKGVKDIHRSKHFHCLRECPFDEYLQESVK